VIILSNEKILHYLDNEIQQLKNKIQGKENTIRAMRQDMEHYQKDIAAWKVHYTSLLNTRLAYESEEQ
jgi:peptidoglycan hydrolase CwlO-like protein